ncbi:MAG: hypothetical protein IJ303_03305, partial [Clostridia bacterium]|nr:hypothetical protein [Clostridia bacterium]
MNILTDSIRRDSEYTQLLSCALKSFDAREALPIVASGLCEGASDALLVSLIEDIGREKGGCALIVCAEEKDAVRGKALLERFGLKCGFYIARDLTFYNITASHDYEHERLNVLYGIINGELDAVVTTPDAALGYTVPPQILTDSTIKLEYGKRLSIDETVSRLLSAGYVRCEMVDSAGQFAVRGGIIDIFPPCGRYIDMDGGEINLKSPLRIELFGDEIDRLAMFDSETQRITENLDSAEIMPARELLIGKETKEKIKKAISLQIKNSKNERAIEELISEVHAIENGLELNFADKYISLIYPEKVCLLDYLKTGARTLVALRGTSAIGDRLKSSGWHMDETIKELLEAGTISPKYTEYSKSSSIFDA